jgi:hypothetical protein
VDVLIVPFPFPCWLLFGGGHFSALLPTLVFGLPPYSFLIDASSAETAYTFHNDKL